MLRPASATRKFLFVYSCVCVARRCSLHTCPAPQTLLSMLSCVTYVVASYDVPVPSGIDLTFAVFFTLDYWLRFYAASNRVTYVFSLMSLVCAHAAAIQRRGSSR